VTPAIENKFNEETIVVKKTATYEGYPKTLDMLSVGKTGAIAAVGGQGVLRRRLLDMGLTPGTQVKLCKVAPMGDPLELELRGYSLTLRKEDAAKIELKNCAKEAPYHA
jgi:Fe2+ transport system protein FeoA